MQKTLSLVAGITLLLLILGAPWQLARADEKIKCGLPWIMGAPEAKQPLQTCNPADFNYYFISPGGHFKI